MARIKAFKAVRPVPELVSKVAALPYDVMNTQEAKEMVKGNPYSFLHIDRPEISFEESIDLHDPRVYKKAQENLLKMINDGVYVQDKSECLYIYQLKRQGKVKRGIVTCTSIDDYIQDVIKKHEHTLEVKEKDRINHVKSTGAHTGPIMMAYREHAELRRIIDNWVDSHDPVYDFKSLDNVDQTVWVIDDNQTINTITAIFAQIPALYIADGHHRSQAAVSVGLEERKKKPDYSGDEAFNYFLSILFPDVDMTIMDYNRVIKDLNGLSAEEFLIKIEENFDITYKGKEEFKPTSKFSFGMYLEGMWYGLIAKVSGFDKEDPVASLDVSILQNLLIEPILGISDVRTDKRIDFVGGIRGLDELKNRVDSGEMKVAFALYPTSIEELMNIADAGQVMPPKSTWFEPKLQSGIFLHLLT